MTLPALCRRAFLAKLLGLAVAPVAATVKPAPEFEGVDYVELLPFVDGSRRFRCRWEDRYRFMNALCGRKMGDAPNYCISAAPPEHPRHRGLYVSALEITGEGTESVNCKFPDGTPITVRMPMYALFKVGYSKPEFIPGMAV